MTFQTIAVRVEGTAALIQHRFGESAEGAGAKSTRRALVQRKSPRDEAAEVVYQDSAGRFYHPGAAISRLLREAGAQHKLRGSRKSAKSLVPAAVICLDDAIELRDPKNDELLKSFEVDSRPVVIPSTKGRIMRHRPRYDIWAMNFRLRVNDEVLPVDLIHQLLQQGGEQLGIGDFRPERGGPFGTFLVKSFRAL